ncbi:uncharacterized protein A4U43_C03F5680 [Asparagus officinalis]|uniref:Uncharacterized protein n=1 Tax=Asparagus officinalis TaxID=4686 RepID=A0A5P1F7M5_ASPOF|nr:uncharacterized protein A4U43_C03F5680 [Asparagus officinalis]
MIRLCWKLAFALGYLVLEDKLIELGSPMFFRGGIESLSKYLIEELALAKLKLGIVEYVRLGGDPSGTICATEGIDSACTPNSRVESAVRSYDVIQRHTEEHDDILLVAMFRDILMSITDAYLERGVMCNVLRLEPTRPNSHVESAVQVMMMSLRGILRITTMSSSSNV